jgi:uncharacterized protein DUF1707
VPAVCALDCVVAASDLHAASYDRRVATRQPVGTRAKDSDREAACQVLDHALGEGQLSMDEHHQRVSAATNATTLGDLQSLVSDLQTSSAPAQLPKLKTSAGGGWGMRIAVGAVLVLFGVGVGWGIFGQGSPVRSALDPGAKPDGIAANTQAPPRQLQSAYGLSGLLEQARKKFGDTMGYRLLVYPDYGSIDRPDPNDDRRKLDYTYHGGWDTPSVTSKDTDDRLVDLGKFDVNAIIGRVRGAPQILGIEQRDVKTVYFIVEPSKDPTTPDAVQVQIHVSTNYGSGGYLTVDPQGNVINQYPPS